METQYTVRSTCRVCHDPSMDMVMDYGWMPLAGGFVPSTDPRADTKFPLTLMRCKRCTNMQTGQDIAPEVMFSQYSYSSGTSPGLVDHFYSLSNILLNLFNKSEDLYIDVGCNDGVLINPMLNLGVKRIIGIDPSDVALRASNCQSNWTLINEYLTPDVASRVVEDYGKASLITACNVLAHSPDPHPMLEGIRRLLSPGGIFVAEVHYQASMVSLTQFDTVYHEHTCYYSLRSLIDLFKMHDLTIWKAVMIANHGGSIRVFASPSGTSRASSNYIDMMVDLEAEIDWMHFTSRSHAIRDKLWSIMSGHKFYGRNVMAYGASGRGTILMNWCKFDLLDVIAAIDKSPLRAGKVVPGVKIPIFSPSDIAWTEKSKALLAIPDVFLLTAWNYADSIQRQHPEYTGKWLVPLPEVRYL